MLARTRQPHRVAESDPEGLGEGDEGGRSLRPTPASWSPLSPVVPLPPGVVVLAHPAAAVPSPRDQNSSGSKSSHFSGWGTSCPE